MRRILHCVSPKVVMTVSIAICLLCIEHQQIHTSKRTNQKPIIIHPIAMSIPETVVDVAQLQELAVLFQFCPSGTIETVELNVSCVGSSPTLKVTILQNDGSIIHTHVVLGGLQVEEAQDGTVRLKRIVRPAKAEVVLF